LNIGSVCANLICALPGYDVFDVVTDEASKNDNITTTKGTILPANGVDVDAIVDASEHPFRVDSVNDHIVYNSASAIPVSLEVLFGEGSWEYFIAVGVVDRCGMPSKFMHRKAVTSLYKIR